MYSDKYENIWTRRFIGAAIIQGGIIVGLTVFLVLSQISFLKPEVSRVIAAGGAGTWFTFGFVMYIVVGVIGVAVSALFYYYLEKVMGISHTRSTIAKIMAWIHLLLMNIGTSAAMGLLMYVGYIGGAAALPKLVGGGGLNAAQIHGGFLLMYRKRNVGVLQGSQKEESSRREFRNTT